MKTGNGDAENAMSVKPEYTEEEVRQAQERNAAFKAEKELREKTADLIRKASHAELLNALTVFLDGEDSNNLENVGWFYEWLVED